MGEPVTIAVLISGRGSNLQALIDACAKPGFPAKIGLVLSNRPDAAGLQRAEKAGLRTAIVDHKLFSTREAFDETVEAHLHESGVGFVCLAGFMRIFGAQFTERWLGRIVNIHPSLLPAFPGLHPHAQALAAGVKLSGCTVHFVTPDVDAGPIIGQAAVPVLAGDTEEVLAARVLEAEHKLYPACVRLLAERTVTWQDGQVVHKAVGGPSDTILINPPLL